MATPSISRASYDAASGKLSLYGANFTPAAIDYIVAYFTLSGDGGIGFTLHNDSTVFGIPTSSNLVIQLSQSDRLAVNGLFNKNGTKANDGSSDYNLAATNGWDNGAEAISNLSVSVSHASTPTISAISYNTVTGVFTFTGKYLSNHGVSSGIAVDHFSLTGNGKNYAFSATDDKVGNLSADGFSLSLSAADTAIVNNLFDANGLRAQGGTAYRLSVAANWDSNSGAAIASKAVFVSGIPTLKSAAYDALSGLLTLTGNYLTTSADDYKVGNLTLKGDGGLSYTLSDGSMIYGTPNDSAVIIKLSAADKLAIDAVLDKNGQKANDGVSKYNLSALSGWDIGATAISTQTISVDNVLIPSISSIGYDASSGIFTVAGANLLNRSGDNGIVLSGLKLVGGNKGYRFNASNDSISHLSANGFNISLSDADKVIVDALINGKSAFHLNTTIKWNGNSSTAITTKNIAIEGNPVIEAVSYDAATGALVLNGQHLKTVAADYQLSRLILKGDGGASYNLTNSSISGGLSGDRLTIQLSAADRLAVDGLLNANGNKANDGKFYKLIAASGWDGAGAAVPTHAITVINANPPMISAVNYNAVTGVFTFNGENLSSHGNKSGIALNGFKLSCGSVSYTFNAARDTISDLSADGFSVTLSSADKALVDTLLNANGSAALNGATYNLAVSGRWDSNAGTAINALAVTVNGIVQKPLPSDGLYGPSAIAIDADGNLYIADSAYDFNPSHNAIREIVAGSNSVTTLLSNGLYWPSDIAIDSAGNLYVANMANHVVLKIAADSRSVTTLLAEGLSVPEAIAVDNAGNVYIADTGNHTIQKVSADGQTVDTLCHTEDRFLQGITVDGAGNVYFAYADNHSIMQIAAGSNSATTFYTDDFYMPAGLAVDGDGNLYFSDSVNNAIVEITADSHSTITLADSGLSSPGGFALDEAGNVYIANHGDNSVKVLLRSNITHLSDVLYDAANGRLTLNGKHLSTASRDYDLTRLSLRGDAAASYTLSANSRITGALTDHSVSIQLSETDRLAVNGLFNNDGITAGDGYSNYSLSATSGWQTGACAMSIRNVVTTNAIPPTITAVDYNADAGVFTVVGANLVNHGSGRGIVLDNFRVSCDAGEYVFSDQDTLGNFSANGFTVTLAPGNKAAVNAVFNTDGAQLYIGQDYTFSAMGNWNGNTSLDIGNMALTVNEAQVRILPYATSSLPNGIAVDKAGNIYIADSLNNAIKFIAAGSQTVVTLIDAGLNSPGAIVVDTAGNLYVADTGNNAVKRIAAGSHNLSTVLDTDLASPQGIAIDAAGNIYVADTGNNVIKKISAGSHSVSTLLSGELNSPASIAVDTAGNLYIADSQNSAIMVLAAGSSTATALISAGLNQPMAIAADSAGNLYISDTGNDAIKVIPYGSQNISTVLASGLSGATGIAIDGAGNVYVADTGHGQIKEILSSQARLSGADFDAAAGQLHLRGSHLSTLAGQYSVTDFSIRGDGATIYLLTAGSSISGTPTATDFTIQLSASDRLAVDGLLNKNGPIANDGRSPYLLSAAHGWDNGAPAFAALAVNVANAGTPALTSLNYDAETGTLAFTGDHLSNHGNQAGIDLSRVTLSNGAGGSYTLRNEDAVTGLSSTGFSVMLNEANRVTVNTLFSTNGTGLNPGQDYKLSVKALWDSNSGPAVNGLPVTVSGAPLSLLATTGLHFPSGIAVDATGNIYIADMDNHAIKKIAAGSQEVNTVIASGLFYPAGIAVDNSGNLYIADAGNLAIKNLAAGDTLPTVLIAGNIAPGNGLAVDAAGNVYFADSANNAVKMIAANSHTVTTLIASGLLHPTAVTLDKDGNLYIADSGNNAIKSLASGSQTLTTLLAVGLSNPSGIAVDDAGNVFIADTGHNAVKEILADSHTLITLVSSGLNMPEAIAADTAGHLYLADANHSAIKKIDYQPDSLPMISGAAYDATAGTLTLSGTHLATSASRYTIADFMLQGDGGAGYTLSQNSSISGNPTDQELIIQLSAADRLAVNGLLNRKGNLANDGHTTYTLSAYRGWESGADALLVQNVSVTNVISPTLSDIRYNAMSGIFSFSGSNLVNAGNLNGIDLSHFELNCGPGRSYRFNAASDCVGLLCASGFSVTLSKIGKAAVNALLVDKQNKAPFSLADFTLKASADWDSDSGDGIDALNINVTDQPLIDLASSATVITNATIKAAWLLTKVNDPNRLAISTYDFRDESGQGYFVLNGIKQTTSSWISIKASDLNKLSYVGSNVAGSEHIDIAVYDGLIWSAIVTTTVTTLAYAPILDFLQDDGIRQDVGSLLLGSSMSYTVLLQIFNDVAVDGVSAMEFTDLQTLVGHFSTATDTGFVSDKIAISPYLYDVANKLVNGDAANAYWTGGSISPSLLGNLAAGSSETQMTQLIQKWLLGADLPSPVFDNGAIGQYVQHNNALYNSSGTPTISDINQNQLGDCYLLACLGEVAKFEPNTIKSMITANGNGTYGIRFYIQGNPVYITVNKYLPEDENGHLLANNSINIWASLIEKAYVQLNEHPGYTGYLHTAGNSWTLIDGGFADPITQITGKNVSEYDSSQSATSQDWAALKDVFVKALQNKDEMVYASYGDAYDSKGNSTFVASHMFSVTGYDKSADRFILQNPWGVEKNQTWDTSFQASIDDLRNIGQGTVYIADNHAGINHSTGGKPLTYATTDSGHGQIGLIGHQALDVGANSFAL